MLGGESGRSGWERCELSGRASAQSDPGHVALRTCFSRGHTLLGTGTLIDGSSPVNVAGQRLFRIVRAGDTHSCGVDDQARGWCWGNNQFAQVVSTPVSLEGSPVSRSDSSFRDIGVGEHWTCGLLAGGAVRCWGVRWDRSGAGGRHPVSRDGWVPEISSAGTIVALSVGARHACIVTELRRVSCWGL
jgi:alpha-tubulin suppressor-like RCC1 family protein